MSGLFGEAQVFADLAEQWRVNLDGPYPPGKINYFKMDEAVSLSGAFNSWREDHRDQKVRQLAKLIDRGDLLHIAARLDVVAFDKVSKRWEGVRRAPGQKYHAMGEPYINLFLYVFTAALKEAQARGAKRPVDIIFDEQDMFRETILNFYSSMRRVLKRAPELLALMPPHPMFRDDKDFVVIQAADMLTGEQRLLAENYADNPDFIGHLCPSLPRSKHCTVFDEVALEQVHAWNVAWIAMNPNWRDNA